MPAMPGNVQSSTIKYDERTEKEHNNSPSRYSLFSNECLPYSDQPLMVHPSRYWRLNKALAEARFVTRPAAPLYSIF